MNRTPDPDTDRYDPGTVERGRALAASWVRSDFEAALPLYVGSDLESIELAAVQAWLVTHPEDRPLLDAAADARGLLVRHAEVVAQGPTPDLWPAVRAELAADGLIGAGAPATGGATRAGSGRAGSVRAGSVRAGSVRAGSGTGQRNPEESQHPERGGAEMTHEVVHAAAALPERSIPGAPRRGGLQRAGLGILRMPQRSSALAAAAALLLTASLAYVLGAGSGSAGIQSEVFERRAFEAGEGSGRVPLARATHLEPVSVEFTNARRKGAEVALAADGVELSTSTGSRGKTDANGGRVMKSPSGRDDVHVVPLRPLSDSEAHLLDGAVDVALGHIRFVPRRVAGPESEANVPEGASLVGGTEERSLAAPVGERSKQ